MQPWPGRESAAERNKYSKSCRTPAVRFADRVVNPLRRPGRTGTSFASLEKAYAAHDLQLQYLGLDPSFDPLRADPRFRNLLLRVGLPANGS